MIYCKIAVIVFSIIGFFGSLYNKVSIEDPATREKEVSIHIISSVIVWALYYGCGIFDLWPEN